MYSITVDQLLDLGIARATISSNVRNGKWKTHEQQTGRHIDGRCEILMSSLPSDLQIKCLHRFITTDDQSQEALRPVQLVNTNHDSRDEKIERFLARLSLKERRAWVEEARRLIKIIGRYNAIKPKRELDAYTRSYVYVPAVLQLCDEAVCKSHLILKREPHRANPPSPHTLRRWSQRYRDEGILAFFRNPPELALDEPDLRRAVISIEAVRWVNSNWKQFSGARHLYKEIEEKAKAEDWLIPSESWFYRAWDQIPKIVKTYLFEGEKAYLSKYAPYVPRDFSDLEALQILCGDHSERDITIVLPDKTLARPWLTPWQDLRTGMIWGSHLGLVPSSQTAALAYANGVKTYGAQPLSRPDRGFYSYVYTDNGRTFKSHRWDGKVIAVHKSAMALEGGMSLLLTERKIGILTDLKIRHLLAQRRNAKEKPIERFFKDVSAWERNTFDAYCGPDPSKRPERWRILFEEHQQFLNGKRETSPFPTLEQYRESLDGFITRYNHSPHNRSTLGGERIIPIEEYRRLYTTRYEISPKTLALLLLKSEKRVIEKDGVNCFRRNWYYYHESMSPFKGNNAEVLFSDDDYRSVWVILPNNGLCEAKLISPTSILNPNKETLQTVRDASAKERQLIKDFQLLNESQLRGETTEDRVMKRIGQADGETLRTSVIEPQANAGSVHQLTRFDHSKLVSIASSKETDARYIPDGKADDSMFASSEPFRLKEFEHE
jgi:hypothetical protein